MQEVDIKKNILCQPISTALVHLYYFLECQNVCEPATIQGQGEVSIG